MLLSLIVAYGKHRVIGNAGTIPWTIPADMRYFRTTTKRSIVIMGRKTHESIGRALPDRANIVITRQKGYEPKGRCTVVDSLGAALKVAEKISKKDGQSEAFVIGGSEVYKEALPLADKLYITEIEGEFTGDTFFPAMNAHQWELLSKKTVEKSEETAGYTLHFCVYKRKKKFTSLAL